MKKWYKMIVKAIEVTKKYTNDEVKQLSLLFSYLNSLDIDEEWFWTWISAKGLWKLLNPLTRTWKSQPFREWWESVSNLSRLKENIDFERKEIIKKISNEKSISTTSEKSQTSENALNEEDFDLWEKTQTSEDTLNKGKWWKRDFYGTKELWNIYWEMTNLIYLELFWVKAIEYKQQNDIPNKYFAKDFFTKDWLFDLEKVENKLWAVIWYIQPVSREKLKDLIKDFLNKEVKVLEDK